MAQRRDRRAEIGHRPVSNTEPGDTTPRGKHGPAPSTGTRDAKGAASMAAPKPPASMARHYPSVRNQYGPIDTTPPTGPEHSDARHNHRESIRSTTQSGASTFPTTRHRLHRWDPSPPDARPSNDEGTPRVTPLSLTTPEGTTAGRDRTKRRRPEPGPPPHRPSGQLAGPTESAEVGDRHHRMVEPESDEAFIAAAALARRARLRRESSTNRPADPQDAVSSSPTGTSAAELVRIILGPGTPTARKATKGGLAPTGATASTRDERNTKQLMKF